MAEPAWPLPVSDLRLADDEVHAWRARLDVHDPDVGRLAQTLSTDERERASRFHFARDRQRFVVGRGLLRSILGRYLGVQAAQIRLCYGPHGKPCLAGGSNSENLQFNLAHSQDLMLVGVGRDQQLGVDLEYLRPLPDAAQIAAQFFSARERAAYSALPETQKMAAFYACWTRKEAYLKALGGGLALPLDSFDVSLAPGDSPRILAVHGLPDEAERWSVYDLVPAPGYAAALVIERGLTACRAPRQPALRLGTWEPTNG
jgi:4'-phosphopantetheinyl transferase